MKLSSALLMSCILCTAVHADPLSNDVQRRASAELAADASGLLAYESPAADPGVAEHEYARRALHFGDVYNTSSVGGTVTTTRDWQPYEGELNVKLSRPEFYRLVRRSDLADRFERHTSIEHELIAAAGAGMLAAGGVMLGEGVNGPFATRASSAGFIGGLSVGLGGFIAAYCVAATADGLTEREAQSLADRYNETVRREVQASSSQTRVRDVRVSLTGTGVALSGAF